MILDTLNNAARYIGLKVGISEAFGFLSQPGLADLPDGKYDIVGNCVYAMVVRTNGRHVDDGQMEGHRRYIDIQYIISGSESMGWAPREGLACATPYDAENDIEFFEGKPLVTIPVQPGSFAVFLPSDGHQPLIGEGPIHKVIVKVAVK